jgi:hypothetical protein
LSGDLQNLEKAFLLCADGLEPIPKQSIFGALYSFIDLKNDSSFKEAMKNNFPVPKNAWWQTKTRPTILILEKKIKEVENIIIKMFMEAVYRNDSQKIVEIADAVSFYKKRRNFTKADPARWAILFWKDRFLRTGYKPTIREVAETGHLNFNLKSDDGFSSLRRKCKELGLPLSPSRKTRLK